MRHYLEYIFAKLAVGLLWPLPISVSSWFARCVGDILFFFMRERRQIALANIKAAFGDSLSENRREQVARASFENMVTSVMELFLVGKVLKEAKNLFQFEGLEHVERVFALGRGAVLPISHLGAWEYLSFTPFLTPYRFSTVVKEIRNPYLNRDIYRFRKKMTVTPIAKVGSAKIIFSELKKNHGVAILIDQWAGPEGIWVDFFGRTTSTTSIPVRFAKKTGCPILPAYCIRKSPGRYVIRFKEPISLEGSEETWERETTLKLNKALEEEIRKYPEQWTWAHRRWKPEPSSTRIT